MISILRRFSGFWVTAVMMAVFTALMAVPSQARADKIDDELTRQSPKLMNYLTEKGLLKVGVLRFRVKKGNAPFTLSAGAMNTNMVNRIENMLILEASEKNTKVRTLTNPGQVIAAQKAKMSYLDQNGRAEILKLKYPVVDSNQPVSADAFIVGQVELNPNYSKTTVKVSVFSLKRLTPEVVLNFDVDTDRGILSDIGETFVIASRSTPKNLDKAAVRVAASRSGLDKEDVVETDDPVKAGKITDYVQFSILYNGDEQKIDNDTKLKQDRVPEPDEKTNVVMKIKNVHDRQIGAVLLVNGVSTIFEEDADPNVCRKWVLDSKEEVTVRGYLCKDRSLKPFTIAQIPPEPMSLDKVGQIQLLIFDGDEAGENKISSRGVLDTDLRKVAPRTFEEQVKKVKDSIANAEKKARARGVIVPSETQENGKFKEVPFTSTSLRASQTIYYLNRKEEKKDEK